MESDTHGEANEVVNNCNREWINDCPFPECKCGKKISELNIQRELEEYRRKNSITNVSGVGIQKPN